MEGKQFETCPLCGDKEPYKKQYEGDWGVGGYVFGGFCCDALEKFHTWDNISLDDAQKIADGTFDWAEYDRLNPDTFNGYTDNVPF